jgi:predicted metalloprotease with PDZ domain
MRILTIIFFIATTAICSAMDEYVVRVPDVRGRLVHVEARVMLTESGLLMSPEGAGHLEFGWAQFVRDLVATAGDGSQLAIERMPGGSFKIDHPAGNFVDLKYTIHIGHDQQQWPFGAKEAAYVQDEMMMATGNALFITRLDMDSARVRFELPEGQRVLTAWNGEDNEFVVKGAEELVWTVILLGKFERLRFKSGDMIVVMAFSEKLTEQMELIRALTIQSLDGFWEYYGGPPVATAAPSQTYLQVINVDSTYEGGGAVFTNSISIMLNEPPARCDSISTHCWHHIVVHELGHLWNGLSLVTNEQDQWFREGFNDHLAWRLQRDLGLYDEDQFQQLIKLKEKEAEEGARGSGTTLLLAGNDKARNYDMIYSGGFTFAQKLDNMLLNATIDHESLISVYRLLYERHAGKGTPIDRAVLQQVSEEVCGCSLKELFSELEIVH